MGSAESVPQGDGATNGHNDFDGDGFRRVAHRKKYRLPSKQCSSPTRRSCHTSATDLTFLASEITPIRDSNNRIRSSCECEDLNSFASSSSDSSDCWGGLVLQSILSRISPQKKNAISSFNESIGSTRIMSGNNVVDDQYIKNGDIQGRQLQLDLSDESESSCASPTRVTDFPLPSSDSLPKRRLHCHNLRPPFIEEHHQQEESEDLDEDFPSPCKRLDYHLESPIIEQQYQDESNRLQGLLRAASKYEEEYNLYAAISSLEEYLHQLQSLAGNSFACEHSKATILHKIGVLQWKCGRYFFSEHVLGDCIHTYRRLLDESNTFTLPEHEVYSQVALDTAHALVSIGRVYLSKGEGDAAMQCYNECVRQLSLIKTPSCSLEDITPARLFSQASVGAGRVLASQGKFKSSLKRYKRALKVQLGHAADSHVAREEISDLCVHEARAPLNDIAETLSHLGRLYEKWNDVTRALECHTKALSFYRSVLDPNAVDIGYVSNNLGRLYLRIGWIAEAEEAFKTAHQVFSLRLGKNHRNTVDALLSIGQVYAAQGKHKRALGTFKRVLRVETAPNAVTFHSIACSYEATFRTYKALKYYQREANVLRAGLPTREISAARLLHYMAKIAMQTVDCNGEYTLLETAENWIEEAAEIYYNQEKNDHELLHLESCIEEIRRRTKRKAQKVVANCHI